MLFQFIAALRRNDVERDTHDLAHVIVQCILTLLEELRLDVSPAEFNRFPSSDAILEKLNALRVLSLHNPRRDEILQALSKVLATLCNAKAHKLRRYHERFMELDRIVGALKTEPQIVIELLRDLEEVKAQAASVYCAARAIYLRSAACIMTSGLVVAGEAGMVAITWLALLGDDGMSTPLVAASMAVATLGINELMVRLGFAPLYEALLARVRIPQSPFPPLRLWIMSVFHLLINWGVIQLRGEFVSENLEDIFLANSALALTVLSIITHFLTEKLAALYPAARDKRREAAAIRDEVRHIQVRIRLERRMAQKGRPYKKRVGSLDRKFQDARSRACREIERDPKVATVVRIFADALATAGAACAVGTPDRPVAVLAPSSGTEGAGSRAARNGKDRPGPEADPDVDVAPWNR